MKTLRYSVRINAPAQQVWDTMLQPDTYKQWVAASWPDSFYEGRWGKDETILFLSESGTGTKAVIDQFEPHRFLSARHVAIVKAGGAEDAQSEEAKNWIDTRESYQFKEGEGYTELVVEVNTDPRWEAMFNTTWPMALEALKQLCTPVRA